MARVSLTWHCSDEQAIEVEVETDATYPDALDEMCTRAVRLLKDSCEAVVQAVGEED